MVDLNFQVDIKEQGLLNGDFVIQGTAINSVITSNNHQFLGEELKKSADSLRGVPLLKDHNNAIDSIVGRVLTSAFNETDEKIDFRAKVVDIKSKQLIKQGLLNTVSVGAIVDDIEEGEDGIFIPRGITFKELSLVAVPADSGATFQIALKEAYQGKESQLINTMEVKMTEEETQTSEETPVEEPKEEVPVEEEKPEAVQEPEATPEPEKDEEAVLDEALKKARIKAKQKELKRLQEADADETPVEEPTKEEPKDEEEEEVEEGLKFEQSFGTIRGGSITYVR